MEFLFDPGVDLELFEEADWQDCLCDVKSAAQIKEKEGAPKSPPKGYPTEKSLYADPSNFSHPIDTEKHVRAALSYFSKPENRKKYSKEEQNIIWARIVRAAKKLGIKVEKTKLKAEEVTEQMDLKLEELKKVIADFQALLGETAKAEAPAEQKAELAKLAATLNTTLVGLEVGLK